jgi:hypothetical protein
MARQKGQTAKDAPGWLKADYSGFSLDGVSRQNETFSFKVEGKEMETEYSPVSIPADIAVLSAFFGNVQSLRDFVVSQINARLRTQATAAMRESAEPSFDAFLSRALESKLKAWKEKPGNAGRNENEPAKNGKGSVKDALLALAKPEAEQRYQAAMARFNAKSAISEDEI